MKSFINKIITWKNNHQTFCVIAGILLFPVWFPIALSLMGIGAFLYILIIITSMVFGLDEFCDGDCDD